MSKGTVTIPLDEYKAMQEETRQFAINLYAEQNKNDELAEILNRLGINKELCNAVLNGAEVKNESGFDYATLTHRYHFMIVLEESDNNG